MDKPSSPLELANDRSGVRAGRGEAARASPAPVVAPRYGVGASPASSNRSATPARAPRVCLVEDSYSVMRAVFAQLKRHGCHVDHVSMADDALAIIKAVRYDAILVGQPSPASRLGQRALIGSLSELPSVQTTGMVVVGLAAAENDSAHHAALCAAGAVSVVSALGDDDIAGHLLGLLGQSTAPAATSRVVVPGSRPASAAPASPRPSLNVCLLEDSYTLSLTLCDWLANAGQQVDHFTTAAEVLGAARTNAYDAVIVDVSARITVDDFRAFVRQLRAIAGRNSTELPLVALMAEPDTARAQHLLHAGANKVIVTSRTANLQRVLASILTVLTQVPVPPPARARRDEALPGVAARSAAREQSGASASVRFSRWQSVGGVGFLGTLLVVTLMLSGWWYVDTPSVEVAVARQGAVTHVVNAVGQVVARHEVALQVDADDAADMRVGLPVRLATGDNQSLWKETVLRVGPEERDPVSAIAKRTVFVSLGRAAPKLTLGQRVFAQVSLASSPNAIKLPFETVFSKDGQNHVAIVQNERVAHKPVQVGVRGLTEVEIQQGLVSGDFVILPREPLREGQRVSANTIVQTITPAEDEFPQRAQFSDVAVLTTEQLMTQYDASVIVDVRSKFEFDVVHIAKAVHVPVSSESFLSALEKLRPKDGERPLVFYCNGHSCRKSYEAARAAQTAGFKNVYAYDSGVLNWLRASRERTTLLNVTPAPLDRLVSDDYFQGRLLDYAAFKKKTVGKQAVVIDIRDAMQREMTMTLASLAVPLDEFLAKLDRGDYRGKQLLIFDAVGKQVVWLQYILEDRRHKDYFFLRDGIAGIRE